MLAVMCFVVLTSSRAQDPGRVGQVVQHYAARDSFSGTVTVAHPGGVTFQQGYGFADHGRKTAFSAHTRFNIGSISKQFTAAAILLLQQDGKLKTTDHINQLLPPGQVPKAWSAVTVRQLLSHTSGLQDYFGSAMQEISHERDPAELLAMVQDAPLDFTPGEAYGYSNTNYLLLGLVVQHAAGTPYCTFLRKRIFNPLGMRDTQCLEEPSALQNHAIGYAPSDSGETKPLAQNPPAPVAAKFAFFGAGNLVSTGEDLVRWTEALHHGRVLSDASYVEMTTPVRNGYAYGLQIGTIRGHMRIDHAGSVPGFLSELEYFPATGNVVVILSNQLALSTGFSPGTHVIDSELMTIAAEPGSPVPSEGKEVLSSPRVLRLFCGRYVSDDGKPTGFTITLAGEHLQLLQDGPGHTPSELRGDYGEVDFYLADSEADLEFSGQNQAVLFDLRYSRALPLHRVAQ